jgi:hypothetical protein
MCTSTFTAVMHHTHSNREACMNATRARRQRLMNKVGVQKDAARISSWHVACVCSGNKYDANEEFFFRALACMRRVSDYNSHARA